MLSKEQGRRLLQIAGRSLEEYVRGKHLPRFEVEDAALTSPGAAFVTLRRGGELRGCIGMLEPVEPLFLTVARMARAAALEDPRFTPVTAEELPEIEVEISVLGPLEQVHNVEDIEVGKHGLRIQQGFYSGVLLPQVATEYGWDRVEFLRYTCRKAGLPLDAWEKGAEIYRFTAQILGEERNEPPLPSSAKRT